MLLLLLLSLDDLPSWTAVLRCPESRAGFEATLQKPKGALGAQNTEQCSHFALRPPRSTCQKVRKQEASTLGKAKAGKNSDEVIVNRIISKIPSVSSRGRMRIVTLTDARNETAIRLSSFPIGY